MEYWRPDGSVLPVATSVPTGGLDYFPEGDALGAQVAPAAAADELSRLVVAVAAVSAVSAATPAQEPNRPVAIASAVTATDSLAGAGLYDEPSRPVAIHAAAVATSGLAYAPDPDRPVAIASTVSGTSGSLFLEHRATAMLMLFATAEVAGELTLPVALQTEVGLGEPAVLRLGEPNRPVAAVATVQAIYAPIVYVEQRVAAATATAEAFTGYHAVVRGTPSLVAYYRLADSGAAAVEELQRRDGTYFGGVSQGQTGALRDDADPAVRFDGASGVVQVGQLPATARFTILAWAYSGTATWNVQGWIASARAANGWVLEPQAGSRKWNALYFRSTGASVSVGQDNPTSIQGWHLYALTFDGTTARMYFDSTLARSAAASGRTGGTLFNVRFGADTVAGRFGNGFLDEIELHSEALTAAQIALRVTTARGPQRFAELVRPVAIASAVRWTGDERVRPVAIRATIGRTVGPLYRDPDRPVAAAATLHLIPADQYNDLERRVAAQATVDSAQQFVSSDLDLPVAIDAYVGLALTEPARPVAIAAELPPAVAGNRYGELGRAAVASAGVAAVDAVHRFELVPMAAGASERDAATFVEPVPRVVVSASTVSASVVINHEFRTVAIKATITRTALYAMAPQLRTVAATAAVAAAAGFVYATPSDPVPVSATVAAADGWLYLEAARPVAAASVATAADTAQFVQANRPVAVVCPVEAFSGILRFDLVRPVAIATLVEARVYVQELARPVAAVSGVAECENRSVAIAATVASADAATLTELFRSVDAAVTVATVAGSVAAEPALPVAVVARMMTFEPDLPVALAAAVAAVDFFYRVEPDRPVAVAATTVATVVAIAELAAVCTRARDRVYPGQLLTFGFTIEADTVTAVRLRSGVAPNGSTHYLYDPANERLVQVPIGTSQWTRRFKLPATATPGLYDAEWSLYDSAGRERFDRAYRFASLHVLGAESATPTGAYATAVLADAPVGYWRLGETSGTAAADSSGNGRTGVYTGGVALNRVSLLPAEANPAALFNGTTGHVAVPGTGLGLGSGPGTLECWARLDVGFIGNPRLLAFGDNHAWELYCTSDRSLRVFDFNGGERDTGYVLSPGTTYHLAFTVSPAATTVYANGAQVWTEPFTAATSNAGQGLSIGQAGNGADFWRGTIDEVAVYRTALSAARVLAHYTAGVDASTRPTAALASPAPTSRSAPAALAPPGALAAALAPPPGPSLQATPVLGQIGLGGGDVRPTVAVPIPSLAELAAITQPRPSFTASCSVDSVTAHEHEPALQVYIDGRDVSAAVLTLTIDQGYDIVAASAAVQLARRPSWLKLGQELEIWGGYDGRTIPIYRGWIEDDGRGNAEQSVKAEGAMRLTQYPWSGEELQYARWTDTNWARHLLTAAGTAAVTSVDLDGANEVLATERIIRLEPGSTPLSLLEQVDQVVGYDTFDYRDGSVRRRRVSGVPNAEGAWTYRQGLNVFECKRGVTSKDVKNKVIVTGIPQTDNKPITASRTASSEFVPKWIGSIPHEFRSDLVQTVALAGRVADRLLDEVNRPQETISLEAPFNPYLAPAMTIVVRYPQVGIDADTPFLIRHVRHDLGGHATTSLQLAGGAGPDGYVAPGPPEAAFAWRLTREVLNGTEMYVVTADGHASTDPAHSPEGLIYSWENNLGAPDFGDGALYTTWFTEDQMNAYPAVTLRVETADARRGEVTHPIDVTQTKVRELYVAANEEARASPDGGSSWGIWNAGGGQVLSTPEIAPVLPLAHSYFGVSDGRLVRTDDFLATPPTLMRVFAAGVTALWVHEANSDRVLVGLADGTMWMTTDAGNLGDAAWTKLTVEYGLPIQSVSESGRNPGEIRAAVGSQIRISYDSMASDTVLLDFGAPYATARRQALSNYQNYYSASLLPGGSGAARRESGEALVFAGVSPGVLDVPVLTHHIRDDSVLAVDASGRAFTSVCGRTELSLVGRIANPGQVGQGVRDGDDQRHAYVATSTALWVTTNWGQTWEQLQAFPPGGVVGLEVGYGNLRSAWVDGNAPPPVATGDRFFIAMDAAGTAGFDQSVVEHFMRVDSATGISFDAPSEGDVVELRRSVVNQTIDVRPPTFDWVGGRGYMEQLNADRWFIQLRGYINEQEHPAVGAFLRSDTEHGITTAGVTQAMVDDLEYLRFIGWVGMTPGGAAWLAAWNDTPTPDSEDAEP